MPILRWYVAGPAQRSPAVKAAIEAVAARLHPVGVSDLSLVGSVFAVRGDAGRPTSYRLIHGVLKRPGLLFEGVPVAVARVVASISRTLDARPGDRVICPGRSVRPRPRVVRPHDLIGDRIERSCVGPYR